MSAGCWTARIWAALHLEPLPGFDLGLQLFVGLQLPAHRAAAPCSSTCCSPGSCSLGLLVMRLLFVCWLSGSLYLDRRPERTAPRPPASSTCSSPRRSSTLCLLAPSPPPSALLPPPAPAGHPPAAGGSPRPWPGRPGQSRAPWAASTSWTSPPIRTSSL